LQVLVLIIVAFVVIVILSIFGLFMTWIGGIVAIITYLLLSYVIGKLLHKIDDGSGTNDNFINFLKNIISFPPAFLIAVSSPVWDVRNYCAFHPDTSGAPAFYESDLNRCIENIWDFVEGESGFGTFLINAGYWINGLLLAAIIIFICFFIYTVVVPELKTKKAKKAKKTKKVKKAKKTVKKSKKSK